MTCIEQLAQDQRRRTLVIGPAEHFVIQLSRFVVLHLVQQSGPALWVLWVQVERVCDLRYMVPCKSCLALGYLMVICTVCSVQRTATFMTDYTMLAYHLKQVLLRVWDILCPAVRTWYDPLGFGCPLPEQSKRSICGLRGSCILCIAPVLGG